MVFLGGKPYIPSVLRPLFIVTKSFQLFFTLKSFLLWPGSYEDQLHDLFIQDMLCTQ
jgi:hypothetical protein